MPLDKTGSRGVCDAERVAIALHLRRDGLTFDAVAAHPGPDGKALYSSRQAAARAVARELRRLPAEEADTLRAVELLRLDELHRQVWPQVGDGDPITCPSCEAVADRAPNLHAATTVLRIMERRARLCGLDASDENDARMVAVAEQQVAIVAAALRTAIERAGIDPADGRRMLEHLGTVLREHDDNRDALRLVSG